MGGQRRDFRLRGERTRLLAKGEGLWQQLVQRERGDGSVLERREATGFRTYEGR